MSTSSSALATVEVHIAPGVADTVRYDVVHVAPKGRALTAVRVDGAAEPETFTKRRNGHFARKGEGQWSMYMRGSDVTAAIIP